MPIEEVDQEILLYQENIHSIDSQISELYNCVSRLEHDKEALELHVQSICTHKTTIGYESYVDDGTEYPGFKLCVICHKVL